jgi:MoxR-like ATPase
VIATENPIESEGTFPLPAAQLDRFSMRLSLGYPDEESELAILNDNPGAALLSDLKPVITVDAFLAAQNAAENTFCHPVLKDAIVGIVRKTRTDPRITLGASPRSALHFLAAARARALVKGRDFVDDGDIAALAAPVLAHRLKTADGGANEADSAAHIVNEITGIKLEETRKVTEKFN